MLFNTILVIWLAAAVMAVMAQPVYVVRSGFELVTALADASGPNIVLLANDNTLLTEADFRGFELPVVLQSNKTIQGRPDRWATLNTTHTQSKMRLGDGVTLILQWVILFDLFGDVSGGASTELFTSMATGEVGTVLLQHTAYSTDWCYPPDITLDFLGSGSFRPTSFPGQNVYKPTVEIPPSLRMMEGGLSSGGGDSNGSMCTNDTLAPPMRRCWGHVAYCEDFAVEGTMFDSNRILYKRGYYLHLKDTYLLCRKLLTLECVAKYTAYGCLKAHKLNASAAAAGGSAAAAAPLPPPVDGTGHLLVASTPPDAARDAGVPAPRAGGHGASRTVGSVVGVVAGALAATIIAVLAVLWRRRRGLRWQQQQQQQQQQRLQQLPGAKHGAGGRAAEDLTIDRSPSKVEPEKGRRSFPLNSRGSSSSRDGTAALAVAAPAFSNAKPAAASAAACVSVSCGKGGSGGGTSGNVSIEYNREDNGSDLPAARQGQRRPCGASAAGDFPASSDLLDGKSGPASPPSSALMDEELQEQQQLLLCSNGADGGGKARHVVVTPFTPLRPDLQLCHDIAQEVTLLPVVRGKGSYGQVCEGLYGGQRVAVKMVREFLTECSSQGGSDKVLSTFAQEVEVLGRCRHPNVVRLLAACMRPPRFCLVMELMETSLQRLVFGGGASKRLLPLPQVLHIGCEIARALEYLHPTIVHRDLKPDNVLISNAHSAEPIVKVSDFGLSRLRCTVSPTLHPEAGTPAYMAPECFDLYVSSITHHVDIYSWAVVMWTMLSGVEPWTGCGIVEIAYRVTLLDERLILDGCASSGRCPPRLQRLMTRCWNRVPELRPAAAEVVKEMMLIIQQRERSTGVELDNYMSYPGSVLNRIREYQAATTAATTVVTTPTTTTGQDAGASADAVLAPAPARPAAPAALPTSLLGTAAAGDFVVDSDLDICPASETALSEAAPAARAARARAAASPGLSANLCGPPAISISCCSSTVPTETCDAARAVAGVRLAMAGSGVGEAAIVNVNNLAAAGAQHAEPVCATGSASQFGAAAVPVSGAAGWDPVDSRSPSADHTRWFSAESVCAAALRAARSS